MLISFYSVWHAVLPGSSSLLFGRRGSRAYQDVPKDSFDLHEGRNVSSGLLSQQETKLNLTLLSHCSIQELFRSFPSEDPIVRESTSLRSRGGLSRKRSLIVSPLLLLLQVVITTIFLEDDDAATREKLEALELLPLTKRDIEGVLANSFSDRVSRERIICLLLLRTRG